MGPSLAKTISSIEEQEQGVGQWSLVVKDTNVGGNEVLLETSS